MIVPPRFLSHAEQLAEFLRGQILAERWTDQMPGILRLEGELGVCRDTVEAAMKQLENEGLLTGGGPGRRRQITLPMDGPQPRALRVMIFRGARQFDDTMIALQAGLALAGYSVHIASKTQQELGGNLRKVARFVKKTEADAWVVVSGASELLEWFVEEDIPAIALFGQFRQLPITAVGIDKSRAVTEAVRRLTTLGHRRIVTLAQQVSDSWRSTFFAELEASGITTGAYNLTTWDGSPEDFHRRLDLLFGLSPPTALFLAESPYFLAAQAHLARRGLLAPEQVSLICDDPSPAFDLQIPSVAHCTWDARTVVRRVVRWADNIARGIKDKRQSLVQARFEAGGTMGPVPERGT